MSTVFNRPTALSGIAMLLLLFIFIVFIDYKLNKRDQQLSAIRFVQRKPNMPLNDDKEESTDKQSQPIPDSKEQPTVIPDKHELSNATESTTNASTSRTVVIDWDKVEKEVYSRFGYAIVTRGSLIPEVRKTNTETCDQIFQDWLDTAKKYDPTNKIAPRTIPDDMVANFTMFGHSQLEEWYCNNILPEISSSTWTFSKDSFNKDENYYMEHSGYGREGQTILNALKWIGVKDKEGIVIGSLSPWIETYLVYLGAKQVLTLEYSKITVSGTDTISAIHPIDFVKNYDKYLGHFDFIATFSSVEHSGLGRFGDPLDAIGDLREMAKSRCTLKQGGYMFLGLPVGRDRLPYNAHRVYGKMRTPMMLEGFRLISVFDTFSDVPVPLGEKHFPFKESPQLTFVLQKL